MLNLIFLPSKRVIRGHPFVSVSKLTGFLRELEVAYLELRYEKLRVSEGKLRMLIEKS